MRILSVILAATLLAGCSAAAQTPVRPTAEASAPSAASPSPTAPPALTAKQAARRYLAIVKPYNVALETLEKAINGGQPQAVLRRKAAEVAKANATEVRRLKATVWPKAVRGPIRELVAESVKAHKRWVLAARAQTRDALIREVLAAMQHDGKAAAQKLRGLLHLEKYDEGDYS